MPEKQPDSGMVGPMKDNLAGLKRMVVDPKIYALVVRTNKMAVLHVGVYYSLDEAFRAVKTRAMEESKSKDATKLGLDLWMWEVLPADSVLKKFFGSSFSTDFLITKDLSTVDTSSPAVSTSEYAKQVYGMKNELMKRIIDNKDEAALEEAKSFLSDAELKLIRAKITPVKKVK